MAERDAEIDEQAGASLSEDARTPRWVKVFAALVLAVIVLVVVLIVSGRGGGHGPGRHAATGLTVPSELR